MVDSKKGRLSKTIAKQWISTLLSWWSLMIFCILNVAAISGIVVLTVLSKVHSGFVRVETSAISTLGYQWDRALLWTSLPNLLVRIIGIYWDAIVAALIVRQPFVNFHRYGEVLCTRSILLDYRSQAPWERWVRSFQNRHFLLTVATLLAALMLPVTSLAAHLFVTRSVPTDTVVSALVDSAFNENGINASTDWKPIFDTVAATLLYGGNSIDWTDDSFAFQSFTLPEFPSTSTNITKDTLAYSAHLNCQELSTYSVDISERGVDPQKAKVQLQGIDRGCPVALKFQVSELQMVYLQATPQAACSSETGVSRLVFASGSFSNSSQTLLSQLTFISCLPTYSVHEGDLTLVFGSNRRPSILSFKVDRPPSHIRPKNWIAIEQNIFGVTAFDANSAWSTNAFGDLVLYLALQLNKSAYLQPQILQRAIETMFASVYLTATAMHSFSPQKPPATTTAIVSQFNQRLFVVPWVAYILLAASMLLCFCTVWVWLDIDWYPSILQEEPQGIFSAAGLLRESNMLDMAGAIQQASGFDGQLMKAAHKRWNMSKAMCCLESDQSGGFVLMVKNLTRRVEKDDWKDGSAGERLNQYLLDRQTDCSRVEDRM